MKEAFITRNFQIDTLAVIKQADRIMREYAKQGYKLTLRQLYYQFVARALIKNKQSEYKRLGSIINDARLAGYLDWAHIEDRTRNLESPSTWDDPAHIIASVAEYYKEDLWATQDVRAEVWIEKEALVGVIEPICQELRLPYVACRGYFSQSEAYSAGKRFMKYDHDGKKCIVLHLGDHDPSGMDMTRDNLDRLQMFTGGLVEVRRLALNMNQIEEFNPPPNPAKVTDSRFKKYQEDYGDTSWELDALEPSMISNLIRDEVDTFRDPDRWDEAERKEDDHKSQLVMVHENWPEVIRHLEAQSED